MTRFCIYCGAALKPDAKFCVICGKPTGGAAAEAQPDQSERQSVQQPVAQPARQTPAPQTISFESPHIGPVQPTPAALIKAQQRAIR